MAISVEKAHIYRSKVAIKFLSSLFFTRKDFALCFSHLPILLRVLPCCFRLFEFLFENIMSQILPINGRRWSNLRYVRGRMVIFVLVFDLSIMLKEFFS